MRVARLSPTLLFRLRHAISQLLGRWVQIVLIPTAKASKMIRKETCINVVTTGGRARVRWVASLPTFWKPLLPQYAERPRAPHPWSTTPALVPEPAAAGGGAGGAGAEYEGSPPAFAAVNMAARSGLIPAIGLTGCCCCCRGGAIIAGGADVAP